MARPSSPSLAAALAAALVVLGSLPHGARAAGLAGDFCDDDIDCMSRTCGSGLTCLATTCGMTTASGGLGATMPANFCTSSQFYNPARVCTFGFGKCTKAECCDTLSCGSGVPDLQKATYCAAGRNFVATRLCTNGVCGTADCCVQTRCDSAGGVPVSRRAAYCPVGYMFNNAGLCAAGENNCTSNDCCTLDTRTCAIAFADTLLGLSCPSPSVLVGTRMYSATAANGGCCETRLCSTVPNKDRSALCPQNYAFASTPPCPTGTCTPTDCCLVKKGFCDGTAVVQADGSCKCPTGQSYLLGTGCLCSPGTRLVSGACQPCPYGTYSAAPTNAATCTQCPTNQPYTSSTGAASADRCVNYCDEVLLAGSGACSNGGTCSSLSGDPAVGGSFSCACPGTWMGYGATPGGNCDAPATLLRLRVLPAVGVTMPADFKLYVNDTVKSATPAYALQAPTLACSLSSNPTTPTVPSCTTGGAGALATASGSTTDTRKFVGTQVKLSTNLPALITAGTVTATQFQIEWACSDGVTTDQAELPIVLPGPANPDGAQTLVCTAIVSYPAMTTPVTLRLAAGSVVPVPASAGSGAALLTFAQGTRPICTLPMPGAAASTAATPDCGVNAQPFSSGISGKLGVSNVDMEKYTVAWTCGSPATSQTTDADGNAATPNLPSPGQAVLVCAANFQLKTTQVVLTVSSSAPADLQLTAMQTGMNEACTVTIPAGATNSPATLSCPVSNLNSGVATTLDTNADLTTYLVAFACTTSAGTSVTGRRSISVETTQNGAATATACAVTISALPPLLYVRVNNAAGAPAFETFASQDLTNTCVIGSTNTATPCVLKDGMSPGVVTTLSPRALDANKYTLAWACTGATAAAPFAQEPFSNSATIMLNDNPNAGAEPVTCVGTVGVRASPVTVALAESSGVTLPADAELRVRQSHQSKACSAVKPTTGMVSPACSNEGLSATAGTRTTLSTANVDLALYKVSWSCTGASPPTIVAAGVATVSTTGLGTMIACTATVSVKPAVFVFALEAANSGPSTPWSLSARQSNQGRACTVDVTSSLGPSSAAVPSCPIQPLLPARSTVLATPGLDASRWNVAWACARSDGTAVTPLSDTLSASGALVANSKTVTLDKDANAGGLTTKCTATVTARSNVLLLAATGAPPTNDWTLTAKQATQSSACSVAATAARSNGGAAPACADGVLGFAAGAPVQLGVTGLPASSFVTWTCSTQTTVSAVGVENGNAGAASVTPPANDITMCTATVVAQTTAFLQIAAGNGVAFSASQDTGPSASALCSINASANTGQPQACSNAAPSMRTMLVATLGAGMAADTIVRFSCKLGSSGANMHVSKTSALSAVVMTPPAVETMVCTASVVAKPPILVVMSNEPTVLTAANSTLGSACASTTETNKLVCDSGSGTGLLVAGSRVSLSQAGLTAAGRYRWSCSSSAAGIVRIGDQNDPAASTAAVTLPDEGSTLTCALTYTANGPPLGRLMRRLLM